MAVASAANVQPIGLMEFRRVAIGGRNPDGDERAGRHGDTADDARSPVTMRLPICTGLSKRRNSSIARVDEARIGDQPRLLARPFQQL